ncbi:GNAT family N-acetyltransferase [Algibacter luteus]|uniref:Acetyltransferase (GNAT) family protein n=1 Tax=Algibacter luteus TaxID=1178825 RepID=A0A1M6BV95_9FLAO|nr:GNAT family N-acetyltransferase [Algibacter luteus]SHI52670.1 Acetyltransferase (GNAT) family protein [Algibacter luteus]
MEKSKNGILNRLKCIATYIKYGLFLHGVRNNLAKIGLDFMPYYYCKSMSSKVNPDQIKTPDLDLKLSIFGKTEINYIKNSILGINDNFLFKDLNNGVTCVGLKKDDDIVAFLFIRSQSFYFRNRLFNLNENEHFFVFMYVYENYRGKGIAPYLRYQCYKLLEKEGVNTFYSISEYFNFSAIKYQKKFNAKPLELCLSIKLFKKNIWNFTLKKYYS